MFPDDQDSIAAEEDHVKRLRITSHISKTRSYLVITFSTFQYFLALKVLV